MTPQQQDFYNKMYPLLRDGYSQSCIIPEVSFAQAALETGWGLHAPYNNYFGIKSTTAYGRSKLQNTLEYIKGSWRKVRASFDGYSSMMDSVIGYETFIIRNKRYTKLRLCKNIPSQLKALQESGYATDPNYSQKLAHIIAMLPPSRFTIALEDVSKSDEALAKSDNPAILANKGAKPMSDLSKFLHAHGGLLSVLGNIVSGLAEIAPIPAPAKEAIDAVVNAANTASTQAHAAADAVANAQPAVTAQAVVSTFEGSALQTALATATTLIPELLGDMTSGNLNLATVEAQAEKSFEGAVQSELSMQATKDPTAN